MSEVITRKFKLIDKEGWFESWDNNKVAYDNCFENNVATLQRKGERWHPLDEQSSHNGCCVIDRDEMQFFEEGEPHLWDGKEEIEVNMVVTLRPLIYAWEYKVLLVRGNNVVLEPLLNNNEAPIVECIDNLTTLIPDPKEVFAATMLDKIRSSHPDFAQDTTWNIKELAKMCFEELEGGDGQE